MTALFESTGDVALPARPALELVGRPRVLFIASLGRSGSTLVERLLGQVRGCCSVGELVHLWERGVLSDERCGCGEPFSSCSFWTAVGDEAFGGWDNVGPRGLSLKQRVDRHRYIPLMLMPVASQAYSDRRHRFSDRLEGLYRAIANVSGSPIVIDGSKSSSYLMLLRSIPGIDLRMVHLTRDARGVAYSATKRVRRPEVMNGETYMPTYPPFRSGVDWVIYNSLYETIRARGLPSIHLRYEDVVEDPASALRQIFGLLEMPDVTRELPFIGQGVASLAATHTISGNPMRFQTGDVRLTLDEAWRDRLPRAQQKRVTAVTWPLMRRYGYRR